MPMRNVASCVGILMLVHCLCDGGHAAQEMPKQTKLEQLGVPIKRGTDGTAWEASLHSGVLQSEELFRELEATPSLRKITLARQNTSHELLDVLPKLPNLEELYVSETPLNAPAWNKLCTISTLRRLTIYDFDLSAADLSAVALLRNLEHLQFTSTSLRGADTSAIGRLPKLRAVFLVKCPSDNPSLAGILSSPSLSLLHISTSNLSDDALTAITSQSLEIVELNYETGVTDASIDLFDEWPLLRRLSLYRTGLTDAGIAKLAERDFQQLTHLDLGGNNKLSSRSIKSLAAGKLRTPSLSLSNTAIGAEGLRVLGQCPWISHLDLQRTGLKNEDLVMFKKMTWLKSLNIKGNPVDHAAVLQLEAQLPQTTVTRDGR